MAGVRGFVDPDVQVSPGGRNTFEQYVGFNFIRAYYLTAFPSLELSILVSKPLPTLSSPGILLAL